jgi:RNA polymerase sigma factor (sigma-70 family)
MRNRLGFTLRPDVAEELRWQLADMRDREPARRARGIVVDSHVRYPPTLRLEEEIVWETVRHGSVSPPRDGVNALLARALRSMTTDERSSDLVAHWTAQAWPRLPDAARDTRAAHLLAIGASVRLGIALDLPAGVELHGSLDWLLPEADRPGRTQLGVELAERAVRFLDPETTPLRIELPSTTPLLLDVSWSAGSASYGGLVAVERDMEIAVDERSEPITFRTLAGRVYTLRKATADEASRSSASGAPRARTTLTSRPYVMPTEGADVAVIVRAAAAGDERAWNALVSRFSRAVRAGIESYGLAPDEIEDVLQTTWLRLFSQISKVRNADAIGAWLTTVARREALRVARRREIPAADLRIEVEDPDADPFVGVSFDEQRRQIGAALDRLPAHERKLLSLMVSDPERSYADLGTLLGLPVGSIGPLRGRALARLRRDLSVLAVDADLADGAAEAHAADAADAPGAVHAADAAHAAGAADVGEAAEHARGTDDADAERDGRAADDGARAGDADAADHA